MSTLDKRIKTLEERLGLDDGESERIHYIFLTHPGTNATKEEQDRAFEDYLDRHPERRWRPSRMPTSFSVFRDEQGGVSVMDSAETCAMSKQTGGTAGNQQMSSTACEP